MNNRVAGRYVWYALIVLYVSMSLLPLLSSGYYSDDLILSTLKGQLELQNTSLGQYVIDEFRNDITSMGRLDPVHLLARHPISYVFYDVHHNKMFVLSMILINVLLFGCLIHIVTRDRHVSYLAMLVLPILFQFRLYHDPILSFSGRMQIFVSLILCAMIFLYKYLEHNRKRHLLVSLVAYNLALYFYEVSILLAPLFLIIVASQPHARIKNTMKTVLPYAISVMVALGAMFTARHFQAPDAAGYSGLTINMERGRVLKTFLRQLFASLPLSYYAGNPSRLFRRGFSTLVGNVAWQDMLVLGLFIASYLALVGKLIGAHRIGILFYLGSALMVLPALVVSVSLKYQEELWSYGVGMGYVPVYIQYYGTAFVMAGVIVLAQRKLLTDRRRIPAHMAIMVVLSTMLLMNMQNNRLVVDKANVDLHYRRAALVRALGENILQDVPEHSNLYILDDYALDPLPFVKSDLRGWAATGYQWKNEGLVYLYARKRVHLIDDANDLLGYARTKGSADAGVNDVYLLSIQSYPDDRGIKEGYVVLARIQNIYTDATGEIHFQSSPLRSSFPSKN